MMKCEPSRGTLSWSASCYIKDLLTEVRITSLQLQISTESMRSQALGTYFSRGTNFRKSDQKIVTFPSLTKRGLEPYRETSRARILEMRPFGEPKSILDHLDLVFILLILQGKSEVQNQLQHEAGLRASNNYKVILSSYILIN